MLKAVDLDDVRKIGFKFTLFLKKYYDVITSVQKVTNKVLLDTVMWAKFGNSRISMREVQLYYKDLWGWWYGLILLSVWRSY